MEKTCAQPYRHGFPVAGNERLGSRKESIDATSGVSDFDGYDRSFAAVGRRSEKGRHQRVGSKERREIASESDRNIAQWRDLFSPAAGGGVSLVRFKTDTWLLVLYLFSCADAQTARSRAHARSFSISSARVTDSGTVDESAVSRSCVLSS